MTPPTDRRAITLALLAVVSSSSCEPAPSAAPPEVGCAGCVTYLGARVFDGVRFLDAAVVVEGERVRDVVTGEVRVSSGETRDVAGASLVPGLVDLHVHMQAAPGPYSYLREERYLDEALAAMLRNGVTTALDLGSSSSVIFAARERSSLVRLLAAGPLITVAGGHPCRAGSPPGDFCVLADDPALPARVEEEVLRYAPDVLKLVVEGGSDSIPLPRMTLEGAVAVRQIAEERGLAAIAHVGSPADLELALDAGVTRFAHVPSEGRMTEAQCDRLASAGAIIVATLAVGEQLAAVAEGTLDLAAEGLEHDVPGDVLAALADDELLGFMREPQYVDFAVGLRDDGRANFELCRARGVRFLVGTDAGNPGTFHGRAVHDEILRFVAHGASIEEALATATSEAAAFLGLDDGTGAIERGGPATFVVLDGDVSRDPAALRAVQEVLVRGEIFDAAAVTVDVPADVVEGAARDLAEGESCLGDGECAAGLVCDGLWTNRCLSSCNTALGACDEGSACLPAGPASACVPADGCDLVEQGCANGAACSWVGEGETMCWLASDAVAGEPCTYGFACAAGHQCDFFSGTCYALCDPGGDVVEQCGDGASCADLSAWAGLSVGSCE